jgi:hypothetical protein
MEDVLPTWKITRIEWYHKFEQNGIHKGSNHKIKDLQGCRLRG